MKLIAQDAVGRKFVATKEISAWAPVTVDFLATYDVVEVGTIVDASLFNEGDIVDVTGTSKGRGFTGVVKRWGFKGGRASHGDEQVLRHGGSIGQSAWPGKVFKGVKMPGRYGNKRNTVQNLKVIKVDAERNMLVVKGAVPGPRNGLLMICKAAKSSS